MKIGVIDYCFPDKSWEEVCKILKEIGINAVEVCAGAFDGKMHCDSGMLLKDSNLLEKFTGALKKNNLEISTLSVHANCLHPQKAYAERHISDLEDVIKLASKIDVEIITSFAGLPGAGEDAVYPNWIVHPWPEYFDQSVVEWQWQKKVLPFWKEMAKKARKAGVKFAFELHPADMVYNTETFLMLRDGVGTDEIGCTIDPGHFSYQQIDTVACIKKLGKSIYNFHVKDGVIQKQIADLNGVFDWKDMGKEFSKRSWNYRAVGYGEGRKYWADIIYALKLVGYEKPLNIEHEDPVINEIEGLEKAFKFLSEIIFTDRK